MTDVMSLNKFAASEVELRRIGAVNNNNKKKNVRSHWGPGGGPFPGPIKPHLYRRRRTVSVCVYRYSIGLL